MADLRITIDTGRYEFTILEHAAEVPGMPDADLAANVLAALGRAMVRAAQFVGGTHE